MGWSHLLRTTALQTIFSFDGMRKELEADYSAIYHLNLKGNARTSGDRRRREGGNIFDDQIRVSVGITFFVKRSEGNKKAEIWVHSIPDLLTAGAKADFLQTSGTYKSISYARV